MHAEREYIYMDKSDAAPKQLKIFRHKESPRHKATPASGLTDVSRSGLAGLVEAGLGDGAETRILYEEPGFCVAWAWFKSGFPLYRHSHGPDCLYQVVGGSIRFGTEELGKGDGVFIPGGTPYTFQVGPEGAEIVEFRHEPISGTVVLANNPAFWEKAMEMVRGRREIWRSEPRPA